MCSARRRHASSVGSVLIVLASLLFMGGPAQATFPGPDGRIAFGSDRYGGTHNIFTMEPDGSDVRQLTFLTVDQGAALRQAWSPDGSKLVFEQRNTDGSVRQIYMMNADGTDQHQLFDDPAAGDSNASFSPDGSKVIFARCFPHGFEGCAIYVGKTNGHGLKAITRFVHGVFDIDPAWSPDGTTIAFDSFNRGGVIAGVYLMNADGSGLHLLTPTRLEAADPDWAPDGSRLVFDGPCCSPKHDSIWGVLPDGTGVNRLTFPGARYDSNPTYAPAGDLITFERDAPDFSTSNIMVMKPDGSDVTRIQRDGFLPTWGSAG